MPAKVTHDFSKLAVGESFLLNSLTYNRVYSHCRYLARKGYGFYKVTKTPNGVVVQRVSSDPYQKQPAVSNAQLALIESRLQKLEDALRFISILVIRIDKKINELGDFADDPEERARREAELKDFAIHKGGHRAE